MLAERRVGRVLKGKWTLSRLIGMGGMAAVYEATHRNGKRVAIKMIDREHTSDPDQLGRLIREGYAANALQHSSVVTVDDDDVDEDGNPFLVMELLAGSPLGVRLEKDGPLPVLDVLRFAERLLDVLVVAHQCSVIHRDIKPDNLFVTTEGELKVLDFGIARLAEAPDNTIETKAGAIMGTPGFMAPEQARGRWSEVDGKTDVWSVGATMFTLLTGELVHEAETPNEVLGLTMSVPARSLGEVRSDLPSGVIALVDKALELEPQRRWPDARQMQLEVRRELQPLSEEPLPALTGSVPEPEVSATPEGIHGSISGVATTAHRSDPFESPPDPDLSRRGRSRRRLVGVVLGLGAIGVLGVAFIRPPASPDESSPSAGAVATGVVAAPLEQEIADVDPPNPEKSAQISPPAASPEPVPDGGSAVSAIRSSRHDAPSAQPAVPAKKPPRRPPKRPPPKRVHPPKEKAAPASTPSALPGIHPLDRRH